MSADPIRLLAIIEARTVTGPAKNLLEFCRTARQMDGQRVETSLVTYRRRGSAETDEFLEAAREAGVALEIIEENSAFDRNAVAALRRIVERKNPDVVQTHSVKSHFLLRLSGLWRQKPWVAFHHGYTFDDVKMRAYNLLDRWSLRAPNRIVTMNHAFEEQLIRRGVGPERITVLHNAIDPNWLTRAGVNREEARRGLGIGSSQRLVVAIGRLSREKAFGHLLEAFGILQREHAAAEPALIIVGEGPERGPLEGQIASMGSGMRVRLAGQVSQVARYYAAADVLAISSISEGSPNVLLEAMAARVPVVATKAGGIAEMVRHEESALLVPPGDPPALAAALARLLTQPNEARALAEKAYTLVVEQYSPWNRAERLAGLYGEIVSGMRHNP
jgi:glycosyltransferase involved in cell wall biosynthesis